MVKGKRAGRSDPGDTPPAAVAAGDEDPPADPLPPAGEEGAEEPAILADAATLAGDLRDAILNRLRAQKVLFARLSEGEQREEAAAVAALAVKLVDDAVRLIHGRGAPAIVARVKRATIKKDLELVLAAAKMHPARHALQDAVEENVLIVLADAQKYFGAGGPPEIDKDQGELDVAFPATPAKAGARRAVTGAAKPVPAKQPLIDPKKILGAPPPHDPETGEIADDHPQTDEGGEA